MATAERQAAQPNRFRDAWRGFHRWRRTRSFWGGLLTALAGPAILGTTKVSFGALAFQRGPVGFLSWLIPAILVTCGMLMWFSPQHRILYAVIAAVTALFSLIAVNLGGFFVGFLLGAVGSALSFAWVPGAQPGDRSGNGSADGGTASDESAGDGQTAEHDTGADETPTASRQPRYER